MSIKIKKFNETFYLNTFECLNTLIQKTINKETIVSGRSKYLKFEIIFNGQDTSVIY